MTTPRQDAEGFVQLWPTILLRRTLADHGRHQAGLTAFIDAQEAAKTDLTTDYLAGNLFAVDEPAINWLRGEVNETVIRYLRRAGIGYPVNWTVQGWANINRFGDYHDYHNHPRAYLSGTYYVRVPEEREPLRTRGDLRPGCITFYDPRYAVNAWAIRDDPYIEPEYTVQPEAGLIMLWPSFLNHFVHPNLSREPRISISFNINLKWQDHYLPPQT
ncbi:MAG TPA: TIGR02466 family protein [Kiloniellales bacterium]|nr:TIGR02466 family protein [Kiloniellales bacterium]